MSLAVPLCFPPMGKHKPTEPTVTKTFRLRASTVERMEAYANAHPLQPSLAQIVEPAVNEWLDRHGPNPPKPKR
jgi:hypothetical protein